MLIVAFIALAIALSGSVMVHFKENFEGSSVKLSRALGISLAVSLILTLMMALGVILGDLLRFEIKDSDADLLWKQNAAIGAGIMLIVGIRSLWPYMGKKPRVRFFDMQSIAAVLAMGVAMGINALLAGLSMGLAGGYKNGLILGLLLLFVLGTLGGLFGAMYGRKKVQIRTRRWMFIVAILEIGIAVALLTASPAAAV